MRFIPVVLALIFGFQSKECDPNGSYGDCEIIIEVPADPTPPPYTLPYDATPIPSQSEQGGGSSSDGGDGSYPAPISNEQICADAIKAQGGIPGVKFTAYDGTWSWGYSETPTAPEPYAVWANFPNTSAGNAASYCKGINISVFASYGTQTKPDIECQEVYGGNYTAPEYTSYMIPYPGSLIYVTSGGPLLRLDRLCDFSSHF